MKPRLQREAAEVARWISAEIAYLRSLPAPVHNRLCLLLVNR